MTPGDIATATFFKTGSIKHSTEINRLQNEFFNASWHKPRDLGASDLPEGGILDLIIHRGGTVKLR
jgi:hypothetical protein